MNVEKISWISDGLKIIGEVYIPADRSQPYPALVICHGIPAKVKGPDDRGYPLLAERFCRDGFFVLIFNFRGAGLSEGNFDILGWTRDLEGALNYLALRPEVDQKRVFLMGFSGGAAVSIYVAAQRKEITALVSCASPAEFRDLNTGKNLEDFLSHAREVGIIKDPNFPASITEWKKGFRVVKPLEWVDQIPPRPLLLIHGTVDDVVDVGHARNLYEKVGKKAELFIIKGAEHRLRVDERAIKKAIEWLKKQAFSGQLRNYHWI
ncbi:MAG: alpha/beta fold hydrolase [Deltaproteobacteria bacterium]|nr:alpha/beta fold hydrolase [Deltaproteobacteria bacterium]